MTKVNKKTFEEKMEKVANFLWGFFLFCGLSYIIVTVIITSFFWKNKEDLKSTEHMKTAVVQEQTHIQNTPTTQPWEMSVEKVDQWPKANEPLTFEMFEQLKQQWLITPEKTYEDYLNSVGWVSNILSEERFNALKQQWHFPGDMTYEIYKGNIEYYAEQSKAFQEALLSSWSQPIANSEEVSLENPLWVK